MNVCIPADFYDTEEREAGATYRLPGGKSASSGAAEKYGQSAGNTTAISDSRVRTSCFRLMNAT